MKETPTRRLRTILLAGCAGILLAATAINTALLLRVRDRLRDIEKTVEAGAGADTGAASRGDDILSAMLAEKVERLVEGAKSDQERCLRIARWVAGNIANRETAGADELGWFASRTGLCAERVRLFNRMCAILHIRSRMFNLYNAGGTPGNGHSCAQAYYDGQWHFFDVTYAGAFIRDGKVLSWDEIKADPDAAVRCMVVFPDGLDRWGSLVNGMMDGSRTDNAKHMARLYAAEVIGKTETYGFEGSPDVKVLRPVVDMASGKGAVLGRLDDDNGDVEADGIRLGLSEQLGWALGDLIDTFHTLWRFRNCEAGRTYVVRYHLYRASEAGLEYWAKGDNAAILSGEAFTAPPSLARGEGCVWEIRFSPKQVGECSIKVGYDFRDGGKLLFVDRIEILPADAAPK